MGGMASGGSGGGGGGKSGGGGGKSGGGGMGGGMITNIVSSVANVGAGWFADKQLAKGTKEASQRQDQANALYTGLYDQTQKNYAPYQQGGQAAYQQLLKTYGLNEGGTGQADYSAFQNSPDYQFALQQGQKNLDNSGAARGGLYSGQQLKATQAYGQGLATQNLNNYLNRLGGIADQGMAANNALANYRQGYGQQEGQGITNLGDLALARRLGRANINYKNVAAQDSIWGAGSGGQQQGQSPFGGGASSAYQKGGSMDTFAQNSGNSMSGPGTSSYGFGQNNTWKFGSVG